MEKFSPFLTKIRIFFVVFAVAPSRGERGLKFVALAAYKLIKESLPHAGSVD